MNYRRRFKSFGVLATLLSMGMVMMPLIAWAQVFTNPIGYSTAPQLLSAVVKWILGLVGFVALLSLVWGGTLYIISFGDEAGLKKAKTIIIWSIVGLIVILLAFFIVRTVANILGVGGI